MESIWSKYEENAEKFFVRITHKRLLDGKDQRTCWLTDLKSLYSETLNTSADVMERAQNENPLMLVLKIEEKILQAISTPPNTIATAEAEQITFDRATNRIQLKYHLSENIPLKFYWTLSKCDETAFFEMITMPLIRQMIHAEETNRNLIEIVKRKDLEIEQYKLDGAPPLLRRQFVTEHFNANKMKLLAKPLFGCVSDLLPTTTDTMGVIVDDDTINLNVSSGSRESEMSNDAKFTQSGANSFIPNPSKPKKMKRKRYDEEAKLPLKVEYVDSDDQSDDIIVSNSTVKSDCSSGNNKDGNSSSTKTSVDNDSNGSALSTKTPTKKVRNILNL